MAMNHCAIGVAVLLLAATQLLGVIEASKWNLCVDRYTKLFMTGGGDWVDAYTEAVRLCH